MAAGVSTWWHSTEKLRSPSAWAWSTATAVGGAVVSNPMARNTACCRGWSRAHCSACSGEVIMRTWAPSAWALRSVRRSEAGTRSTSP